MKLDDTMLMYGIYNAEMLEKLIKMVQEIHNATSSHEKLFAGEHDHSLFRILYTDAYAYNNMQLIHYFSSESFKTNTYHCTEN